MLGFTKFKINRLVNRRELYSNFSYNKWNQLDTGSKWKCLQQLENHFAAEQGRPAVKVLPISSKEVRGNYGGYDPDKNVIYIKQKSQKNKKRVKKSENTKLTGTESSPVPEDETTDNEQENQTVTDKKVIVLDPGHSAVVATGTEPLGPGSSEQKAADASGTRGISSGVPEYELTLNISVQLKEVLEQRGYQVVLTRESNNVPISCVQRAEVANNLNADVYVRIHANGSENSNAKGAMTICTTPNNPYNASIYGESKALSEAILDKYCEVTGCNKEYVWETDTMSGNNWSQVPVTIVEMGYMTNPEEDVLMQTAEYQQKMVQGIADGIDAYMENY